MLSPRVVALMLLMPIFGVTAQDNTNQCPAGSAVAEPYGPPLSRADSGRIYSYLVSPDGREFYFFKKVGEPRSEDYRIFRAVRQGNGWSTPEQLRLGVDASDLYPSLSADGSRLVFSSYRPVPGDTSSHPNAHIYLAHREANGWSTPQLAPASRIGYYHSGLQQLADGTLTFRLTTPDWRVQREMALGWSGSAFARVMTERAPNAAVEHWRAQSGDTMFVWGALAGPNDLTLLQVSRIIQPGNRRAAATFMASRPAGGGRWTPLSPAGGGLGTGSPNFAWFSADGCWLHYTRDYSEFMRVAVTSLQPG